MALNLLGMKAIPLQSLPDRGFTPFVDGCRTLIGPKKGNHPRNPTGTTYSPALITAFANLAREKKSSPHHRRNIEKLYYHRLSASQALLNFDRSSSAAKYLPFIHLFSFSKLYCLPGHRLGAIAASPQLLASIKSILDMLQICPPCPIQLALAPLLPFLRSFVADTAKQLQTRARIIQDKLAALMARQRAIWITRIRQPSISPCESGRG